MRNSSKKPATTLQQVRKANATAFDRNGSPQRVFVPEKEIRNAKLEDVKNALTPRNFRPVSKPNFDLSTTAECWEKPYGAEGLCRVILETEGESNYCHVTVYVFVKNMILDWKAEFGNGVPSNAISQFFVHAL